MFRQEKGITLIALVITIIVLLILAGVTIAMLSGENGILSRATSTQAYNEIAAAKENILLKASENIAKYYDEVYAQQKKAKDGSNPSERTWDTLKAAAEAAITTSVASQTHVTVSYTSGGTSNKITYSNGRQSAECGINIDNNTGKITFDPITYTEGAAIN